MFYTASNPLNKRAKAVAHDCLVRKLKDTERRYALYRL